MKVYVAAPYQLRPSAVGLKKAIERLGGVVTSRWLTRQGGESNRAARMCLADIDAADVLVALNPATWATAGTGGRHVELGYALAREKRVLLVGVRNNVFHHHSDVQHVDTVFQALELVGELLTAELVARREGRA